jgi:hypothetical protein
MGVQVGYPTALCMIIHNFKKFVLDGLPKKLNLEQEMTHMGLALEHLCHYEAEGEDTFNTTATVDESWVRHFQPISKCTSIQYKQPRSPVTKKFKDMPSDADSF